MEQETWIEKKRRHWSRIFLRLRTQRVVDTLWEVPYVPLRIIAWLVTGVNDSEIKDWIERDSKRDRPLEPDIFPNPESTDPWAIPRVSVEKWQRYMESAPAPEPEPEFESPFVVAWRWLASKVFRGTR